MRHVETLVILAALVDIVAMLVYEFHPPFRHYLRAEDSLVENASAFLFLVVFLVSIFVLLRANRAKRGRMQLIWLPAAFGFICFGEEISWGERLFNLQMPRIAGIKIDALHDFIEVGYRYFLILKEVSPVEAYALVIGLLTLALFLVKKYGRKLLDLFRDEYLRPFYLLMGCWAVLLACATVIDLQLFKWAPLKLLEELFELNASMALLAAILSLKARVALHPRGYCLPALVSWRTKEQAPRRS